MDSKQIFSFPVSLHYQTICAFSKEKSWWIRALIQLGMSSLKKSIVKKSFDHKSPCLFGIIPIILSRGMFSFFGVSSEHPIVKKFALGLLLLRQGNSSWIKMERAWFSSGFWKLALSPIRAQFKLVLPVHWGWTWFRAWNKAWRASLRANISRPF